MLSPPPTRDLPLPGLDELTPEQRAHLLDYWRRRTDAEWTTMEALDHVRDDLLALGAPSVLLDMAARATSDEARHSRWCHAMAERIAGQNLPPPKLRGSERLEFPGASAAENRLLRPLFAGCLSETIAVCVLRLNRDGIAPGVIREAQRVHLADEVDHSRLGWAFLSHAHQTGLLGHSERRVVERSLPLLYNLARELWSSGDMRSDPELANLGYITHSQVQRGIDTAFGEVIEQGFAQFELA